MSSTFKVARRVSEILKWKHNKTIYQMWEKWSDAFVCFVTIGCPVVFKSKAKWKMDNQRNSDIDPSNSSTMRTGTVRVLSWRLLIFMCCENDL